MKIKIDLHKDPTAGWEWRMWQILSEKKVEQIGTSRKLYKDYNECFEHAVAIAESLNTQGAIIHAEPTQEAELIKEVQRLSTRERHVPDLINDIAP